MIAVSAPPGDDRASYLREVGALLWPAPASVTLTRPGRVAKPGPAGTHDLMVLPGLRRPRLIVPSGPRAAAAAVRRYGEPASVRARLATRTLSVTLGSGLGRVLLRDRLRVHVPDGADTIEAYLAGVLGQPVAISLHLGARRANRKPVLQVLTPAGETIAFVKIGVNPLTAELVRAERDALARLAAAGLRTIGVPDVLSYGTWRGLEVLVLGALPVWQRRVPLAAGQLGSAMTEVARAGGTRTGTLGASEYWRQLARRLDAAGQGTEHDELRAAVGRLGAVAGQQTLSFGAWHGDWTPWNMASTEDGLLVWDWERFTTGVPAGFDALHYWLQAQVVGGKDDPAQAAADCVAQAAGLLAPLGVPPDQAPATALAYLADLSVRYLADKQEQAGARLGAPRRWLIPALAAGTARLPGQGHDEKE
ncbi:MAG TPA: phosphotransferase [Streptosporangiaceae bacterium]